MFDSLSLTFLFPLELPWLMAALFNFRQNAELLCYLLLLYLLLVGVLMINCAMFSSLMLLPYRRYIQRLWLAKLMGTNQRNHLSSSCWRLHTVGGRSCTVGNYSVKGSYFCDICQLFINWLPPCYLRPAIEIPCLIIGKNTYLYTIDFDPWELMSIHPNYVGTKWIQVYISVLSEPLHL